MVAPSPLPAVQEAVPLRRGANGLGIRALAGRTIPFQGTSVRGRQILPQCCTSSLLSGPSQSPQGRSSRQTSMPPWKGPYPRGRQGGTSAHRPARPGAAALTDGSILQGLGAWGAQKLSSESNGRLASKGRQGPSPGSPGPTGRINLLPARIPRGWQTGAAPEPTKSRWPDCCSQGLAVNKAAPLRPARSGYFASVLTIAFLSKDLVPPGREIS